MTSLRAVVQDYLKIRRALGYKLRRAGRLLPQFIDWLELQGEFIITTELAVRWACMPPGISARYCADRLSVVRRFAQYAHALDPEMQVPGARLLPCRSQRAEPYLYTRDEIRRLMQAAESLHGRLRSRSYATLIGLLATTGMRVGEAIQMDRCDVDWEQGLLVVRCGKLGKSRQIILHPTTLQALKQYSAERDRTFPQPRSRAFFLSIRGTRVSDTCVHVGFRQLLQRAGISRPGRPPRMHDMRHAFAVQTLLRWYRDGLDVRNRLAWLSTWLGHIGPISTYWYLTATAELLGVACERLERGLGELP